MTAEGEAWVAGLLRELPALAAVAAPSMPSLLRRRPGYFASAFAFWGVQNREAALRFVPAGALVPGGGGQRGAEGLRRVRQSLPARWRR